MLARLAIATFSLDAYLISLPFLSGEDAHPPADACDFARYCSALDFWSINDHAEALTTENWAETVDTVRQCNSVAGHVADPDLVSFLGWEWTQVGVTPDAHFGHKNVVLAHTDDARIPTRPIASRGLADSALAGPRWPARAERDSAGECIESHPCYGDYRTDYQDDCTAPSEERAWSSPLFEDHGA